MAIIINDNLAVNVGKPIDSKYLNGQTPWASVAAANTGVVLSYRYTGLTVNILGVEYWYANGIADINLVIKDSGIASTGLTTAINGLTKVGNAVKLGGTLTGTTTITDSRGGSAVGIQYGGDYCANFTARSLVDAAYVSGKTNVINTVGTIGQIIYRDSTHLVGCANMIYCDALPSFAFGASNIASGANSASIGGLSNTATAACSAIIAGQSNCIGSGNIGSVILGGTNISLTASTNCCVVVVPNLSIWCTPSGSGNLLTWNSGTKKVGVTSVGASGGLTGATNGLNVSNQLVHLGGALCTTTCITGNEILCLGTSANKLASLYLWSFDDTCMNARCLIMSSSGATYTDLTAVSKQGIKYAADYSLTYDPRSLVDKGYVDSIATGLSPHTAVFVATTGPITLSGNQTIDGVLTTTGMRILVKNQADATINGIYSANTSTWGRTSDYHTNVQIGNGDLIPVTSGSTQNSSIWVLVTPDPIIVGTSSLNYTEFSTVIDVQGGQGICITQVGGTHTICVDATSGCGLAVGVGGLCINNSIGGNGLTYSGGIINVNACSCGAVAAINVGYNGSDNLVVACSDITSMSAIVTGATNGLTKTGQNIGLGGSLTGDTIIDLCGHILTICGAPGSAPFIELNDSSKGACFGTTSASTTELRNSIYDLTLSSIPYAIFHDNCCIGLCYDGDYEANFVPRSLITKQYVHSYVTGGTTVLTANNGLTKQANNNVVLGGALTGNTCIGVSGAQILTFGNALSNIVVEATCSSLSNTNGTSTLGGIFVCPTQTIMVSSCYGSGTSAKVVTCYATPQTQIITCNASCSTEVCFTSNAIMVLASCTSFPGIQYVATCAPNYRASYTCNSLPDVAYVTGLITGGTGISNANNGLTKVGNAVKLGGTLTGTTTISGGQTFNINQNIFNLSGSTSVNITSPIVTLQTTPPAGLTSDAVLVWNSVDKNIKTVSGAALGDKNNVYSHSAVTTSVLLTTGSSYVILVNNSAPVTITLPATPLNGQVFKIKNVSGSAVTNIITVAGNTHNIDGSSTGLINTDYGALELMYDTTLTAWYSLAFIN
jgi:hypothetical protein